jgi:hypothetical protein
MFEKIKEKIFPFIIAFSALSVSASAAVYSVTGLSMLFAGASTAVMIMAASLEVAKLVIASLLYQYWDKLNKVLRIYLTIAAAVLILITSAGIYGYLSSAYQKTADQTSIVDSKVASLETKKKLYENTRAGILQEKQSLSELKGTLSKGSTTQFTDRKGNLVIKSNNASIKQIESASKSDEKLSSKLDVVNDSIFSIESKILEVKTNATATSELGPLKYLSALTGVAMDRIINWYILVIIFVFDPLAIALVIAANFAFSQLTRRKETPIEETVKGMRKVVNAYDDLDKETREWLEADLGENDVLEEEEKQYEIYKEKDQEYFQKNKLDLDGDGVIEEDEIQQVFNKADTNNDGYIDEQEANAANLDPETATKLNQLNKQVEGVVDNVKQYYNFNPEELSQLNNQIEEIKKLSIELGSLKNKKDDDTITYF